MDENNSFKKMFYLKQQNFLKYSNTRNKNWGKAAEQISSFNFCTVEAAQRDELCEGNVFGHYNC